MIGYLMTINEWINSLHTMVGSLYTFLKICLGIYANNIVIKWLIPHPESEKNRKSSHPMIKVIIRYIQNIRIFIPSYFINMCIDLGINCHDKRL